MQALERGDRPRRPGVLPAQPRRETIEDAAEQLHPAHPEGAHPRRARGRWSDASSRTRCQFLSGDADVLVSTTIIESGLDIPDANTLIVERADTLGLSQLYQIRGRVGRRDVPAHAYLFYPEAAELTPEARARLATLADHTELGAGFAIAMRDLEIRGAGDLLGAEQSGHVAALGFEKLSVEMLHEVVAELSGQRRLAARPVGVGRARRCLCAGRPTSPREALKIDLHRRLALVEDEDALHELEVATEDRFGPLPVAPADQASSRSSAKLKLASAPATSSSAAGRCSSRSRLRRLLGSSSAPGRAFRRASTRLALFGHLQQREAWMMPRADGPRRGDCG